MASITDPGTHGFTPPSYRPFLHCDVAVVKGGCYTFDIITNTSLVEGAEGHALGHVVAVPAIGTVPVAGSRHAHFAWAEEAGAIGDIVRFTVEGQLSVLVAASTNKGDVMTATAASATLARATGTSDQNIIATALEDIDNTVTGESMCLLYGWKPLGFDGATHT